MHVLTRTLNCCSGACLHQLSQHLQRRSLSTDNKGMQSLFLSDISLTGARTPLLLGFINYFERQLPKVGFFSPIGGSSYPNSALDVDRHVEL